MYYTVALYNGEEDNRLDYRNYSTFATHYNILVGSDRHIGRLIVPRVISYQLIFADINGLDINVPLIFADTVYVDKEVLETLQLRRGGLGILRKAR